MPYNHQTYGQSHRNQRKALLARNRYMNGGLCVHCGLRQASVADHQPPLAYFADPKQWVGHYVASCSTCSARQGAVLLNSRATRRRLPDRNTRQWFPSPTS